MGDYWAYNAWEKNYLKKHKWSQYSHATENSTTSIDYSLLIAINGVLLQLTLHDLYTLEPPETTRTYVFKVELYRANNDVQEEGMGSSD